LEYVNLKLNDKKQLDYNVTPLVENRSYIQRSIHGDFINAPAMIFPLASTTMQPMLPLLHRELPRDAGGVINIPGQLQSGPGYQM